MNNTTKHSHAPDCKHFIPKGNKSQTDKTNQLELQTVE